MRFPHIPAHLFAALALALVAGTLSAQELTARPRISLELVHGRLPEPAIGTDASHTLTTQLLAELSTRGSENIWLPSDVVPATTPVARAAPDLLVLALLQQSSQTDISLYLQVIETGTHDVIADGKVPIANAPDKALSPTTIQNLATGIDLLVTQARGRQRDLANRRRLTIPFFQTTKSFRLQLLSSKITAACQTVGDASPDIRVVRFPNLFGSWGPENAVLRGPASLTPTAKPALTADAWAWGFFDEVGTNTGVPFPKVPVKVTLNVWRSGKLHRATVTGVAGRLDELAQAVAAQTLALTRIEGGEARIISRAEIAQTLHATAVPWIAELLFLESPEASDIRARHDILTHLLELASAFDPGNARFALEYIVERWRQDFMPRTGLAERLAMSEAWRSFCETHGFDITLPPNRQHGEYLFTDNRNEYWNPLTAYILHEVRAIGELESSERERELNSGPSTSSLPTLGSRILLKERQRELLRRLQYLQTQPPRDPSGVMYVFAELERLGPPEYRLIVAEACATLVRGHKIEDWQRRRAFTQVEAALQQLKDARTAEMILDLEQPSPPAPRPASNDRPNTLAETEHRNEREAILRDLPLPKTLPMFWERQVLTPSYIVQDTTALHWSGDALWIGSAGFSRRADGQFGAHQWSVWRRDRKTGATTETSSFGQGARKVGIRHDAQGGIWIGLQEGGVYSGSSTGQSFVEHRMEHGLGDAHAVALAADNQSLWVAGGPDTQGSLSRYDLQTKTWSTYPLTFDVAGVSPPPAIRLISCSRGHVFAAGDNSGTASYAAVLNVSTQQWKIPAGPAFSTANRWRRPASAVVGDSDGFWVGTPQGLVFFAPSTGQSTDLQLPVAPASAIVTALCLDGDWLWVATDIPANDRINGVGNSVARHLFVLHRPTRQWVGSVFVPGESSIQQIAVSEDTIWYSRLNDVDTAYYQSAKPVLTAPSTAP